MITLTEVSVPDKVNAVAITPINAATLAMVDWPGVSNDSDGGWKHRLGLM